MAVKELTLTFSAPGAKAVSQTRGMEYNDRGFDKSTSMVKVVIVQQYQVNGCLVVRHGSAMVMDSSNSTGSKAETELWAQLVVTCLATAFDPNSDRAQLLCRHNVYGFAL